MEDKNSAARAFGAQVRSLRAARGMQQSELAAKLAAVGRPMSQQTIARLEAGLRVTGLDDLVALAKVFGVTMAELVAPLDEQNAGSLEADVIDGIGAIEAVAAGRAQGGNAEDAWRADVEAAIEELRGLITDQLAATKKELAESDQRVAEVEKKLEGNPDVVDKEA